MSPTTIPVKKQRDPRTGLRTSATLATLLTILGHSFFGFEQAVVHVFVALFTGYTCALLFETIDAWALDRAPGFMGGGPLKAVDWLLSAHMTSITLAFLVYAAENTLAMAFLVAISIGSKYLLRLKSGQGYRHFMNPSNFGIVVGILVFPWIGLLPWGFTIHLNDWQDWAVPVVIVMLGFRLNLLFTKRLPLIATWIVAFFVQAIVRAWIHGHPLAGQLLPLTSIALVLFTFYMITDPQTSPSSTRGQVVFGVTIALAYAVVQELDHVYSMFYAVVIACAARGVYLFMESRGLIPEFVAAPFGPAPIPQASNS